MTDAAFLTTGLEDGVRGIIDRHKERLKSLSQDIWNKPELNYQEFFAVESITNYLRQEGLTVQVPYCDLPTSFRCEVSSNDFNPGQHPSVAVLLEYDALPEIGHACGHNLITEAGMAAFLAAREQLLNGPVPLQGRIVCIGCPAEEGGGGKVKLVAAGAFRDIDFAMMVHPAPVDILEPAILGISRLTVEFFGKEAHASCGPWEGINALDAQVATYNNVALLRQRLRAGHQVHVVILEGGTKPNIIPHHTKAEYMLRAPTTVGMTELQKNVMACVDAAAAATGCTAKAEFGDPAYEALMSNKTMLTVFKHYGAKHGMFFPHLRPTYGSTDMGNVSTVIPSIHPAFSVGAMQMIHTKEFREASGTPMAHERALRAGLSMAMTTLELIMNREFRESVRKEFETTKTTFVGNTEAEGPADFSEEIITKR